MHIYEEFLNVGEFAASGAFENTGRNLFYRKALGIRRFYENCELQKYNGELLYPSGVISSKMALRTHYLYGINLAHENVNDQNRGLVQTYLADFGKYQSYLPVEHTVAGNMYTHSMPNYERILKEGFDSYIPRINNIEDLDMRDGLLELIEGIRNYNRRCVEYLISQNADKKLINALKKVPFSPAENIYEAIVCWNFVLYLDNCDNLGCVDSGLMPYYNGEDITELLAQLFENLNANCGYSMALHNRYNPLTLQCLEAVKGKRRPMIELFVDDNTPDEIWSKAFEVVRTQGGQPAFYNPNVLLKGLQNKFSNITDEDIKKFCGGGCTESMIAGFSNVGSLDAGINLLLILEETLNKYLTVSKTFEDFYNNYITEVHKVVKLVTECISKSQKDRAEFLPLPMRTLLIDDCIDKGLDFNNGGARYRWSIVSFAGIINVIDSLLVIRDMVFLSDTVTAKEMLDLLKNNDSEFLMKCRNNKNRFGIDDDAVNEFSNNLSSTIYSMLDEFKPYNADAFIAASIQFMSQVEAGKNIGATPDGREAHAPLCDSLAAIFGKDTKGPTALLNSVNSLDISKLLGVGVLNFNINPDFNDDILKSLILTYMKKGGIQIQITCASRKILEDAYKNPELHKNLVVRVGGFSEYFNQLSDELKLMIINRTIQD